MLRVVRTAFMLSAITGAGALVTAPSLASTAQTFIGHARYEANRQHSQSAGDPQVFIADPNAPAAGGAQGVAHIEGYRRARLVDDQSLPLFNAQGNGLSLSLGRWLGAGGTAQTGSDTENGTPMHFTFTGLVPFGVYSIFVARPSGADLTYTLYSEATNALTASIDGFIEKTAVPAHPLANGDLISLVYHSDGQAHGESLGDLGITAHEQLALPIVAQGGPGAASTPQTPLETAAPPSAVPADPGEVEPTVAPTAVPTPPERDDSGTDVFVPSSETPAPAASPRPTPAALDDEPKF